jgi:steroid delta-isomerase-like uncharacterized protein
MTNEQVVRDACRVIWSEGDLSRIGEFYAENFQADYPMTDWGVGLEGIRQLAEGLRTSFPDYRERIDELVAAGDKIIVRLTIQGTHKGLLAGFPATGKEVEFRDVTILRVVDGKITEQRGLSDLLSVYLQLGVIQLPAPPADGESGV